MLPRSCRARGNVNGDKRPSFVDGDLDLVPLFLHLRYVVVCSGCRVRRVSMSGCRFDWPWKPKRFKEAQNKQATKFCSPGKRCHKEVFPQALHAIN